MTQKGRLVTSVVEVGSVVVLWVMAVQLARCLSRWSSEVEELGSGGG